MVIKDGYEVYNLINRQIDRDKNLKNRDSNIELLRIVAMVMIVAHHFSIHGNFDIKNTLFINNIWLQFLLSGGKIGVNVFVMISGYFLISSQKIQTKKVLKILVQILFYSLIIFSIFVGFKFVPFNISELIKHILGYPVWWFAKTYLALYFIHPYINKLLNNLEKKEYQKLILFSTLLWSLIPTIVIKPLDEGILIWFIYLYLIGGYLKKYPIKIKCKSSTYFLILLVLYMLTFLSVFIFDLIGIKIPLVAEHATYFFGIEKLSTLLISLFLFLSFLSLKLKYSKLINVISSSTFGIYLIHDSEYTRTFLWQFLFKNASYSNTYLLIPYSLIVIIVVFVVCSVIELLRIYIFEKRYMKLIEKLSKFIDKYINKLLEIKFFNNI